MSFETFNLATMLFAFVFGALSFLSPCVLPLLPGYLSMMSGYSAQELSEGQTSTRRMLRVSLLFVFGFVVVFAIVGVAGTWAVKNAFGAAVNDSRNTLELVGGIVVIVLGLFIAVTAIWNPTFLMPFMRERRVEVRPSRLGAWAPPIMGAAFGFGWTPCLGPALASVLTIASADGSTLPEALLLFLSYGLGLGLPFVLFALGINKLYGALSWFRRHLKPITIASGVLLALFGVLMVTGKIVELNQFFQRLIPELPFNS